MDKRRQAFDRWQNWGFGQRSSSNNDLPAEKTKKDKTERLKELTELLKVSRIPNITTSASRNSSNTLRESLGTSPPVPPPRRQRNAASAEKSFEKLESIEDREEQHGESSSKEVVVERKISAPSMKLNEGPHQKPPKPLHVSISSPHFRIVLDRSSTPPPLPPPQPLTAPEPLPVPLNQDNLFELTKVEPRTIVGSYAQKSIPYRSASFSQVDYYSGKYSIGSPEYRKTVRENRNSASLVEGTSSTSPATNSNCSTYPRRRGDIRLLHTMKLSSPGPKPDQEESIAEEPSLSEAESSVLASMRVLRTIESNDLESLDSVSDNTLDCVMPSGDNSVVSQVVADVIPTSVNEVVEESPPDESLYQTASTCIIPTPVFECCGKEILNENATEWFQIAAAEVGPEASSPDPHLPCVSITLPGETVVSSDSSSSPKQPDSPEFEPVHVEVRKRHTLSSDSANSKQNSFEKGDEVPLEERKKLDKSKRRKGIYIQWPAIDKNQNMIGADSWEIDSPDLLSRDTDQVDSLKLKTHFDSISTASCEPLTPDSDTNSGRPVWPKPGLPRKKGLTYQSSEEKDDQAKEYSGRPTFIRTDSTSENESDRTPPPPSRERHSASPAPSDDLRRYSKRPLRGPYGQMLEAEMKKPSKLHYDEMLEDLRNTNL